MLIISDDGRITLSLAELRAIGLGHLISGIDEDRPRDRASPAALTTISGYTEWISAGAPAISIGWDWEMVGAANQVTLQRINPPRSNLVLHASIGKPCDQEKRKESASLINATDILLGQFVDGFDWQQTVLGYLGGR